MMMKLRKIQRERERESWSQIRATHTHTHTHTQSTSSAHLEEKEYYNTHTTHTHTQHTCLSPLRVSSSDQRWFSFGIDFDWFWIKSTLLLSHFSTQPVEAFKEAHPSGGIRGLHFPMMLPVVVELEVIRDKIYIHGIAHVLLVCEDQQCCILEFLLLEHQLKLLRSFFNSISISAVHNENDSACACEIVPSTQKKFQEHELKSLIWPLKIQPHTECNKRAYLHRGLILDWPPMSHTVKRTLLYCTLSWRMNNY